MIDAHVHIDKGILSISWVNQFIDKTVEKGLDEIYLLQHTNVFAEFMPIYEEMKCYNDYQRSWVEGKEKTAVPISQYIDFIEYMKKHEFPIKVKFELEVCYDEKYEEIIKNIASSYKFDFLTGSIHTIDGWAFSHLKQRWSQEYIDVNHIYRRYYEIMLNLIKCRIFNGLTHPNSLSCFGVDPECDFTSLFNNIADELYIAGMFIEMNSGLMLNYNTDKLGMDEIMLNVMKKHNIKILTASDAHSPEHVGFRIQEMHALIHGTD